MVDAPGALMVWHTAPAKTLEDARRQTIAMGSTGWGGETAIFPSVINNVLGTKFKVIAGFKGMSNIFLGMERGELHGVSTVYGSVKGLKSDWLADKKVHFLAQVADKRIKELPDVPTVLEFAKTDEDKKVLRFLGLSNVIGRSITAPPGVPADRLAALRKAFDATVKSEAFLKETRDKNVDINPTAGVDVQKDVDQLFATPKATVEKVKAIVTEASSGKR